MHSKKSCAYGKMGGGEASRNKRLWAAKIFPRVETLEPKDHSQGMTRRILEASPKDGVTHPGGDVTLEIAIAFLVRLFTVCGASHHHYYDDTVL